MGSVNCAAELPVHSHTGKEIFQTELASSSCDCRRLLTTIHKTAPRNIILAGLFKPEKSVFGLKSYPKEHPVFTFNKSSAYSIKHPNISAIDFLLSNRNANKDFMASVTIQTEEDEV